MDVDYMLKELPMGFSMAIARDSDILNKFFKLNPQTQQDLILKAKNVSSKKEMNALINSIKTLEI